MKKSKVICSSLIACSVLLGGALNSHAYAKSETMKVDTTKPYYAYTGYLTASPKTILDPKFINALNNDNVSFNGYMVSKKRNSQTMAETIIKSNDFSINKTGNRISSISWLPQKGIVNKQIVVDTYMNHLQFINFEKFKNAYTTYHFMTKAGTKVDISFTGSNKIDVFSIY